MVGVLLHIIQVLISAYSNLKDENMLVRKLEKKKYAKEKRTIICFSILFYVTVVQDVVIKLKPKIPKPQSLRCQ